MMPTRSHRCSTSGSWWDEMKTVLPSLACLLGEMLELELHEWIQAGRRLIEDEQIRAGS